MMYCPDMGCYEMCSDYYCDMDPDCFGGYEGTEVEGSYEDEDSWVDPTFC